MRSASPACCNGAWRSQGAYITSAWLSLTSAEKQLRYAATGQVLVVLHPFETFLLRCGVGRFKTETATLANKISAGRSQHLPFTGLSPKRQAGRPTIGAAVDEPDDSTRTETPRISGPDYRADSTYALMVRSNRGASHLLQLVAPRSVSFAGLAALVAGRGFGHQTSRRDRKVELLGRHLWPAAGLLLECSNSDSSSRRGIFWPDLGTQTLPSGGSCRGR